MDVKEAVEWCRSEADITEKIIKSISEKEDADAYINANRDIADLIEQQYQYAELGRLAIECVDNCGYKYNFDQIKDECDNCCFEELCQKRAELLGGEK
jgi:hypothetical protein